MASGRRFFDIESRDEAIVLRLVDPRLSDSGEDHDLQAELPRFANEAKASLVVVDLGQVPYCSTAMINGLIQLQKRLAERGGKLRLSNLPSETREAFGWLRLDRTVFDIYDTKEAALVP